jgi:hypothetical protein
MAGQYVELRSRCAIAPPSKPETNRTKLGEGQKVDYDPCALVRIGFDSTLDRPLIDNVGLDVIL